MDQPIPTTPGDPNDRARRAVVSPAASPAKFASSPVIRFHAGRLAEPLPALNERDLPGLVQRAAQAPARDSPEAVRS
jgi:hypothetical protein